MSRLIRSEVRKTLTTRTAWALLTGTCALVVMGLAEPMINAPEDALRAVSLDDPILSNASVIAVTIFALVLGVRSFTDEFRYGQIVPTLLADPNKNRVTMAKAVVSALAGACFAVAAAAVTLTVAVPWVEARGGSVSATLGDVAQWTATLVAVGALWSMLGVGVGLAVRHQVSAIVGALIWVLVAEALVGAVAGSDLRSVLPAAAARAIVVEEPNLLNPAAGILTLLLWTLALLGVGALVMQRRDIT